MSEPSTEPAAPSVARAGGIMVASLLLSRVLGLVRDTVIASQFGLRFENDAYRIAIRVPDLIFMLIAGGGLSSAFIPVFAEYWHTDRRREAWQVFSAVTTLALLFSIGLVGIAWVFAPQFVGIFANGREGVVPLATHISRVMLPAQIAFLVGSVILATLYARQRFLFPALAPNVYNVGIILGALVGAQVPGLGIVGVAWGALIGAVTGNLVLPAFASWRSGAAYRPSFDTRHAGVRKFFVLLGPVILGFSLPSVVTLITQRYASPFGEGANTALDYANNLMQAPLGIFGQSLALAVFPVLSQFHAQGKTDAYRAQVGATLRSVAFLAIPSAVVLFVLAHPIVRAIYGYGKGNDAEQLARIAYLLQIYCLGVPFWCLQPVLMRGFFSLQQTFRPIAIGSAMTLVFVGLCEMVTRFQNPLGLAALPWATNVAAILLAFSLYVALQGQVGKLDTRGLGRVALKSGAASLPLGIVGAIGATLLSGLSRVWLVLALGIVLAIAGWAYYFVARLLKMSETATLDRAFARLNRGAVASKGERSGSPP